MSDVNERDEQEKVRQALLQLALDCIKRSKPDEARVAVETYVHLLRAVKDPLS